MSCELSDLTMLLCDRTRQRYMMLVCCCLYDDEGILIWRVIASWESCVICVIITCARACVQANEDAHLLNAENQGKSVNLFDCAIPFVSKEEKPCICARERIGI